MTVPSLTHEQLLAAVDYCPETGIFTRKTGKRVGHEAGWTGSTGYRYVWVGGTDHLAHRLAWFYIHGEWPTVQVDHINRTRSDNRIANLRLATSSQNMGNTARHADNVSGFKGVYFHRQTGKWHAQISRGGKRRSLGLFNTAEEAATAYAAASAEVFVEFGRSA